MRAIPETLAARLGAATTLCHCWRLVLRDGLRLGFTDHDRDLVFDGVTHAAASGLDASDMETSLGFGGAGGDVAGALMAAALAESDLAAGRYDGAKLETWLVDWTQLEARVLLDIGAIGEASRTDAAFTVEVRSLAQAFDEPRGRLYQAACSANLGDQRCAVALTAPPMRVSARVVSVEGATGLKVSATGRPDGWFSGGGLYAGARRLGTIRDHSGRDGVEMISVWAPLSPAPAVGDALELVAGCDKSFETCRTKFANQPNFRGFPHMPGNDVALGYVHAGDVAMDGGSLFQ